MKLCQIEFSNKTVRIQKSVLKSMESGPGVKHAEVEEVKGGNDQ